jgi:anthranilate/para-aminobenzoate synthase component I
MNYYPAEHEVTQIIKNGLMVPVYAKLHSSINPVEAFERVHDGGYACLLESARTHPLTGKWSFICCNPYLVFKSKGHNIEITRGDKTWRLQTDPIAKLREILEASRSVKFPDLPGFTGGAVGYLGYDLRRQFEDLPSNAVDDLGLPDIFLFFVDTVIAFDHFAGRMFVISNVCNDNGTENTYREAVEKIETIVRKLNYDKPRTDLIEETGHAAVSVLPGVPFNLSRGQMKITSNFSRYQFEDIVKRAKEYIRAGDIFQANLSQRLCTEFDVEPLSLYKRLREVNPSPFACYLDLGDLKLASSSPERLLKVDGRLVQTRPIAGTRPRGKTPYQNLMMSRDLLLSEKERAEHIMLVDLERNDLGRVCKYGSVQVDEMMVLEEYSHVIHIVSNVVGILNDGKDRLDVIAAAFPGGTITGCPKIRCMEIIDELENVARNVYTGSIGYLAFNGDMDLNIVIRTFVIKDKSIFVQVGAGIVADSDPAREYYETLYKAEGLLEALRQEQKLREKTLPTEIVSSSTAAGCVSEARGVKI